MKPKKKLLYFLVFFTVVSVDVNAALVDVSADTLEKWITVGTTFDFILIDIRDTSELTTVIATDACRPYHLSWNQGVLRADMAKLPKSADIFLYCRSGNRSRTAGQLLVDSGYVSVYHLVGGITGWSGRPTQSASSVKPPSELPAPSMLKIMVHTTESQVQLKQPVALWGKPGALIINAPLRQGHVLELYDMQGKLVRRAEDPFKFSSRFALPKGLSLSTYVARLSVPGSGESVGVFY